MNVNLNKHDYYGENKTLAEAAVATCQKLAVVIEKMKNRMVQEFSAKLTGHEAVLRLALNEAEALAWETQYPHLTFATLAREKAQAAAAWETRQQVVLTHSPIFAPVEAVAHH